MYQLTDHYLHGIVTLKGHKLVNKYQQINEEE
jgi:TetR/AcrR family transcriptional regulator, cholesterol catabolism regulator